MKASWYQFRGSCEVVTGSTRSERTAGSLSRQGWGTLEAKLSSPAVAGVMTRQPYIVAGHRRSFRDRLPNE